MEKSFNYIFVDESGDPGKPYKVNGGGNKSLTGASLFYIISAVCLDSKKLFLMEDKMIELKNKFGYKKEIKSEDISLSLYKNLLNIVNDLNIKTFYRLIDKSKYRGVFAVDDNKKLHNIFDEYNLAKTVFYAVRKCDFMETEVVIDRTDRRLLDGKFDNFNDYLIKRVNTKTKKRVSHVTHVNSEYVYAMQMSDLISGAIKDHFTGRNKDLKKIIKKNLLVKIW